MEKLTLELPAMYGDHHVTEVRRIMLELPGVKDVYASSCFQVLEVTYDPDQVSPEEIKARLEKAGYLGELPVPVEISATARQGVDQLAYYRHTVVYENTRQSVSFAQNVSYAGRPLWPCPGMGVIKINSREED